MKVQFNTTLDVNLAQKLNDFAKERELTKAYVIAEALTDYMKKIKLEEANNEYSINQN